MLAGVGARERHTTAYGAVLHVDHGVADLRLIPPNVRPVRIRAVGEVELRRLEVRAFRQIHAVPAVRIGGIGSVHGLHSKVLLGTVGLLIVQCRRRAALFRLVVHGQRFVRDQCAVGRIAVLRIVLAFAGVAFRGRALVQRDRATLADGGLDMPAGHFHCFRAVA